MIITNEILIEFKERMRLEDDEDSNLTRILSASFFALKNNCGEYDMDNESFKELVFERSRYAYNDALEYFYTNFLTQINNLNLGKALEAIKIEGDSNTTI